VRTWVCAELPAERHLPGRECGITASPALRVVGRPHRAGDATYNNGRLRRRRTERLEVGTVCPMRSVAAQPPLNVFLKPTFMSSALLTLFLLSLVRASLTL